MQSQNVAYLTAAIENALYNCDGEAIYMPKYPQSDLIHRFFMKGQPIFIGKGEVFLGNEPVPNGIYFIATGYVKVYTIGEEGDNYTHIVYGNGEVFPLIWAYIDIAQENVYYESLTNCVLWRVARSAFNDQVMRHKDLAYAMSQQLARQFYLYSSRVDNFEYKTIDEKVLYRILFLASRFGYQDGDELVIEAPITHEILANSINLSRETVSRVVEKLQHQKLLKKTNSRIHILDMEGLKREFGDSVNFHDWGI